MQIKFICPRWGSENIDFKSFLEKAVNAGYHGTEFSLPIKTTGNEEELSLMKKLNLIYIAQHWETHHPDFSKHKTEYRQRLEHLARAKPYFINAHTGKDYFTKEFQ